MIFNHICTLPEDEVEVTCLPPLKPNATLYTRIGRHFRRITLASANNPRSNLFFRSRTAVVYERQRHLRSQKNVYVHPFSQFRMRWELWMTFVLLTSLVIIPLHCILNFNQCAPFESYMDVFVNCLDVVCLIDIIVTFNSGYNDTTLNEVVLDKAKVFKNYVLGQFTWDLLSSIPSDLIHVLIQTENEARGQLNLYQLIVQFLSLLKVFKFNMLLTYMRCTADLYELSQNTYSIIWFIIIPYLITHWIACLHYLIPLYVACVMNELDRHSWTVQSKLKYKSYGTMYVDCMFRAVSYLLCISHGGYRVVTTDETIVGFLSYIGGYIFNGFIFVMVMQILISYRTSSTKYQAIMNQVNEYMRHKKLPMEMQKKLTTYYEYKYKKRYFREMGITEALSDRLKKEINLLSSRKFIESVPILAELPEQLVSKIISHLKLEVYLPNDIIVKAGTSGDSMYFISSGTVTVLTPTGKEICHLQDGAYFGEVALILKDQKRIATVVAIEICEIFKLNKRSFRTCFSDSAEVYREIIAVAEERLEKTVILEELHKKFLMEQSGTKDKDALI